MGLEQMELGSPLILSSNELYYSISNSTKYVSSSSLG